MIAEPPCFSISAKPRLVSVAIRTLGQEMKHPAVVPDVYILPRPHARDVGLNPCDVGRLLAEARLRAV
jgi:hypothetical protein